MRAILKKEKSLGKMSIITSINGVKMVVFSEYTKVCFSMLMQDLIANIKPNPRNGEQPDVYFLDIT